MSGAGPGEELRTIAPGTLGIKTGATPGYAFQHGANGRLHFRPFDLRSKLRSLL
jgi:hypothetical protein